MESEDEVATSMVRTYGRRADMEAIARANNFRRAGDTEAYQRWLRILEKIKTLSQNE